jgi:hypothetical protein
MILGKKRALQWLNKYLLLDVLLITEAAHPHQASGYDGVSL